MDLKNDYLAGFFNPSLASLAYLFFTICQNVSCQSQKCELLARIWDTGVEPTLFFSSTFPFAAYAGDTVGTPKIAKN